MPGQEETLRDELNGVLENRYDTISDYDDEITRTGQSTEKVMGDYILSQPELLQWVRHFGRKQEPSIHPPSRATVKNFNGFLDAAEYHGYSKPDERNRITDNFIKGLPVTLSNGSTEFKILNDNNSAVVINSRGTAGNRTLNDMFYAAENAK